MKKRSHFYKASKARTKASEINIETFNTRLGELAQNAITATVGPDLTVSDVAAELWSPEAITALRRAWEFTDADFIHRYIELVPMNAYTKFDSINARLEFDIDVSRAKMLRPRRGQMADFWTLSQTHNGREILRAITGTVNLMADFGKVSTAIAKLQGLMDEKQIGLPGVRYLCPWLPQLLPVTHPIQEVKRTIAPSFIPADLAALLREVPDVLLAASLAPPQEKLTGDWTMSVRHPSMFFKEVSLI